MRILIIEDEIILANAIKRALVLQKYAVDVVYDGTQGLDTAIGEEYDVILLDWMLPGIDGVTICKEIRNKGIQTPVLMLTAKGQIRDRITGLDGGADDYLIKPFSFEELYARIRALVRRPVHTNEPILKTKEVLLNPNTFLVKQHGQIIQLSAKEFAILEYLLRNKNIVVSREQIVSHVWDYTADVLPGTVEVHIKSRWINRQKNRW